jgi:DNA-binding GntR family transcriptional regulator
MNRPQSIKELAVEEIRNRILGGSLRQGAKVDQAALAADLGVSRLPIREALIVLESEGLIRGIPRRGAFVSPLSREDVRDHYRIFGFVSGLAAERAVAHITEDDLAAMTALADAMEATSDGKELDEANTRFHSIVNRASGSQRLRSTLASLSRSLPTPSYRPLPEWPETAHRDHRSLIAALQERDAVAARKVTADHFSAVAEQSIAYLEQQGFWDDAEG